MKILTITCHKVYNYGASLQAFALQSYLVSLGQDVNIIDFTPDYQNVKYNFWYVPFDSKYNKVVWPIALTAALALLPLTRNEGMISLFIIAFFTVIYTVVKKKPLPVIFQMLVHYHILI